MCKKLTLAESHPELAAEWHPTKNGDLTPAQVTHGSTKKVWWKCAEGHEWEAVIYSRADQNCGCPYCSGRFAIPGKTDLATTNPELAAEWHPTKNGDLFPSQITKSSPKKVWWRCAEGHEWQARIVIRNKGVGCPYCSGRFAIPGKTDLATTNPELAAQWHPTKNSDLTPEQVTARSGQKIWWRCAEGHEWQTRIADRQKGRGCPYCSGRFAIPGKTDLATTNPELAAEWHPTKNGKLTPAQVMPGSNKKVWWMCPKGHEWQASPNTRIYQKTGCPICYGETQTSFPEQAIFYYFSKITTAENRYMLKGKTEIDIYLPSYRIGIEYDGERWHANIQKDIEKNRLCEQNGVRLIRVREPGCPSMPGECIVLKSLAINELNNAIQELCALIGKKVDVNVDRDRAKIYKNYIKNEKLNSLAALHPELAAEWHPTKNDKLTPAQVNACSGKKVWWKCAEGHEWEALISNRAKHNKGCPYCGGKKILPGFNDLATVNPELAAEWHPTKNGDLTPAHVTHGSNKKVWWQCSKGHEWQAVIYSRSAGRGCPECSGRKRK